MKLKVGKVNPVGWKDACKKGATLCLLGYAVLMFLSAHGELELIALVGGLLGIAVRTYFPWIRKVAEGKLLPNFDVNYAITGLLSFVATGHFVSMLGEGILSALGAVYAFITTFLFGLGVNSGLNEAMKWIFGDVFKGEEQAILRVITFLMQPQVVEKLKRLGLNVIVRKSEEAEEQVEQEVQG